MLGTVKCTKCKVEKPQNTIYFSRHRRKNNGLDSWCKECRSTYRNEICRGRHRKVISDEDLKAFKKSHTKCQICNNEEKLVVDHCHATGKIRGMLCNHCNRGLGHFRDSTMLLEQACIYLNKC